MCKITVSCDKCKKATVSMKWKIKRTKHALARLTRNFGYNSKLVDNLTGQIEGLEWAIKKMEQICDCNIMKIEGEN